MARYPHPFDKEILYQLTEDGNIQIEDHGKSGLFTNEGIHLSGELKQCDPQMCNWVSNVPNPDTQLLAPKIAGRNDTR